MRNRTEARLHELNLEGVRNWESPNLAFAFILSHVCTYTLINIAIRIAHLYGLLEVHGRRLAGLLWHRHALHGHVRPAPQVQGSLEEDTILKGEEYFYCEISKMKYYGCSHE